MKVVRYKIFNNLEIIESDLTNITFIQNIANIFRYLDQILWALPINKLNMGIQAWIAQLVAHRLGTWEVRGCSNPGTGDNFSMKINN